VYIKGQNYKNLGSLHVICDEAESKSTTTSTRQLSNQRNQ
jgi:hypothetical protein